MSSDVDDEYITLGGFFKSRRGLLLLGFFGAGLALSVLMNRARGDSKQQERRVVRRRDAESLSLSEVELLDFLLRVDVSQTYQTVLRAWWASFEFPDDDSSTSNVALRSGSRKIRRPSQGQVRLVNRVVGKVYEGPEQVDRFYRNFNECFVDQKWTLLRACVSSATGAWAEFAFHGVLVKPWEQMAWHEDRHVDIRIAIYSAWNGEVVPLEQAAFEEEVWYIDSPSWIVQAPGTSVGSDESEVFRQAKSSLMGGM